MTTHSIQSELQEFVRFASRHVEQGADFSSVEELVKHGVKILNTLKRSPMCDKEFWTRPHANPNRYRMRLLRYGTS